MNNIFTLPFLKKPATNDTGSKQTLLLFNDLYDRYAPAFYGEIKRNLYQEDVCNQTLSDAYQTILTNFTAFDPAKERLFTWCFRIVRKEISRKKAHLLLKEIFACQHHPSSQAA
jgi:DNA-directed RNA polymerase specialized sigma24 family protein